MGHYFVKIDRSTLRRNPHAGRTSTVIPVGIPSGNAVVSKDGRQYTLHSIAPKWEADGVSGKFQCIAVTGPPPHIFPCGEVTDGRLDDSFKLISYEMEQPTQLIEHLPEPTWIFKYQPTPVTCDECGETFDAAELLDDEAGDGQYSSTICPKCGQWWCCEVTYEEPHQVTDGGE